MESPGSNLPGSLPVMRKTDTGEPDCIASAVGGRNVYAQDGPETRKLTGAN